MQFDVFLNKNPNTKRAVPYLLDVQANLLDSLSTRVVVPLMLFNQFKPIKHLHPIFVIDNKKVIMVTNELAGVSCKILGSKVISLASHRQEIIAALDFIYTGI